MNKRIWLSPSHLDGNEMTYIQSAFSSGLIASQGKNIDEFELQLKNNLIVPQVLALNSGTSAIHLALIALDIKAGDEVICQSFTFSATANPILYQGATPIFVDSEETTWNISPTLLEESIQARISKGKKPKAIIAVHLYGMPYLTQEVHKIAKAYNIPVIEDAAEALGSHINGDKCGSFGQFGILSFNGNKIITTSAGGALICENDKIKQQLLHLSTQAKDEAVHYEHSMLGYNYRMSNVLAGIGLGQLELLEKRVHARRKNHAFYKKNLNSKIQMLNEPDGFFSNRWLSCILMGSFEERETIRIKLEKENIESKPLWKPMHMQPIYRDYPNFLNGISDSLFQRGLCLPSGSNLSEDSIYRICQIINS